MTVKLFNATHAVLLKGPAGSLLRLPGTFSALEGVVVEQGEDCAVVGQQAPCYVDHPLALLVGLHGNMGATC